jgi:hypothetical protein
MAGHHVAQQKQQERQENAQIVAGVVVLNKLGDDAAEHTEQHAEGDHRAQPRAVVKTWRDQGESEPRGDHGNDEYELDEVAYVGVGRFIVQRKR